MSEKVLGMVGAARTIFGFARSHTLVFEMLFFTPDRVLVAHAGRYDDFRTTALFKRRMDEIKTYIEREKTEELKLPLERLLVGERFAIPRSEITRAELTRGWFKRVKLKMLSKDQKYEWENLGLFPEKKDTKLEDYENILRQFFRDELEAGTVTRFCPKCETTLSLDVEKCPECRKDAGLCFKTLTS